MSDCYDQSNNEALNLVPCDSDPDSDLKSCCARSDSCASNGLCVTSRDDTFTPYFVSGCTVDYWDDPTCITQCFNCSGNGVQPCGDRKYCCYGLGGCDCGNEDEVFFLDPVRIVASIPISAASTDATSISSATVSVATTYLMGTSTSDSTSTATAGGDSSGSSDGSDSSSGLPTGLGVGLGVGIPLIAIGAGLIWFLKRKRPSKPAEVAQEASKYYPVRTAELDSQQRHELP
ncbi:hypothetical protein FOPG_18785 [Fusarium oxysporum f. sp. conglutinans race 2 54008]|uniref:Mid2 domain-containing protein n=1 Tax=Fusarium oxysporum f. sp. conglutinans race 2 54008 TaxID=1089457 RepID=X0GMX0_FUSOX|nr:hypothetical protein FOPG_18785 [Fusarium oxysporum f. sp. conglutinans race 2 54008]KAI8395915.1 hypothetical protein FOFC_21445 [Fusarium oxysporum]